MLSPNAAEWKATADNALEWKAKLSRQLESLVADHAKQAHKNRFLMGECRSLRAQLSYKAGGVGHVRERLARKVRQRGAATTGTQKDADRVNGGAAGPWWCSGDRQEAACGARQQLGQEVPREARGQEVDWEAGREAGREVDQVSRIKLKLLTTKLHRLRDAHERELAATLRPLRNTEAKLEEQRAATCRVRDLVFEICGAIGLRPSKLRARLTELETGRVSVKQLLDELLPSGADSGADSGARSRSSASSSASNRDEGSGEDSEAAAAAEEADPAAVLRSCVGSLNARVAAQSNELGSLRSKLETATTLIGGLRARSAATPTWGGVVSCNDAASAAAAMAAAAAVAATPTSSSSSDSESAEMYAEYLARVVEEAQLAVLLLHEEHLHLFCNAVRRRYVRLIALLAGPCAHSPTVVRA